MNGTAEPENREQEVMNEMMRNIDEQMNEWMNENYDILFKNEENIKS